MLSRMAPAYYLSQEIFEKERERLFRKLWLFAGLRQMLPEHNSFITRDIAGIPVVIQNFHGQLRAFENVCLHRSAKLQWEPVGKRPLLCRYHGWGYDENGSVANIPFEREIYQFDKAERACLRLRQFSLRAVGNVLFINLDASPLPLEEQFDSAFLALLESSSNAYDSEVMVTTWHGKFNWKLAYENLRDANHPRFVHPQSLAKYVTFTAGVDTALNDEATLPLDSKIAQQDLRAQLRRFSYGGAEAPITDMPHFSWHALVERWGNQDAYFNWLAYPNLHIATGNGGFSFTLEHHIPVSPEQTDVEIYWLTARKKQPYAYSSSVLLAQMHGSKLVVGEDIEVMEMVQRGLHHASPTPRQGAYEAMNKLVERWYCHLLEADHAV